MDTLYNIIINNKVIDGHSHLFDSNCDISKNPIYDNIDKIVCFIDIEPRNNVDEYKDVSGAYDKFIKNSYDPAKHIPLVSGTTIENIIKTYNEHKNVYKGFGEIKCYDFFKGEKIGNKNIQLIKGVCEFSSTVGNLPIYIHYSLTKPEYVKKLKYILNRYPNIPIVLCHCGMEEWYNRANNITIYDNDSIFRIVVELMKQYSNLWVDITYTAANFFAESPFLLYNLDMDRVITGMDLNPVITGNKPDNVTTKMEICKGTFNRLNNMINNTKNIGNLFAI